MDLDELIKTRVSVRKFKDKEVSDEIINQVIDSAKFAPSSCNRQALKLLIVKNKEGRAFLGDHVIGGMGFAKNAACLIVVLVDCRQYPESFRHLAYIDTGLWTMNLLLKSELLGLSTCPINFLMSKKKQSLFYKKFGLPDYYLPTLMVALGYKDINSETIPRMETEKYIIKEIS